MNTRNSSKSGLFLMELILAILFFCVAAAICVELFVTSHQLSSQSVSLNHAVTTAESIAEAFYGCDGDEDAFMQAITPILQASTDSGIDATVAISMQEELLHCNIQVYECAAESTSPVYELNVALYPHMEVTYE